MLSFYVRYTARFSPKKKKIQPKEKKDVIFLIKRNRDQSLYFLALNKGIVQNYLPGETRKKE
jgi:hypothetical protein